MDYTAKNPTGAGADSYEPIRLTSDFVFKYVFGSETSTNILRSFLDDIATVVVLYAWARRG